MSQTIASASALEFTAFPLTKYSHVTSALLKSDARLPWLHISNREDLVLTFDKDRIVQDNGQHRQRRLLNVFCGTQVMEHIDLDQLVDRAVQLEQMHPGYQFQLTPETIMAVFRSPSVAFRYPVEAGQIHRFQVRFGTQEACQRAVRILREIGFPVKETSQHSSGNTAVSSTPGQSSGSLQDAALAQPSYVTHYSSIPQPGAAPNRAVNFPYPVRSPTSWSLPPEPHNDTLMPPQFSRPANSLGGILDLAQNPQQSRPSETPQTGPYRSNSSVSTTLMGLSSTPSERNVVMASTMAPPPKRLNTSPSSQSLISSSSFFTVSECPTPLRPGTSPVLYGDRLSQVLPPRRELPFPVPQTPKESEVFNNSSSPVKQSPIEIGKESVKESIRYARESHERKTSETHTETESALAGNPKASLSKCQPFHPKDSESTRANVTPKVKLQLKPAPAPWRDSLPEITEQSIADDLFEQSIRKTSGPDHSEGTASKEAPKKNVIQRSKSGTQQTTKIAPKRTISVIPQKRACDPCRKRKIRCLHIEDANLASAKDREPPSLNKSAGVDASVLEESRSQSGEAIQLTLVGAKTCPNPTSMAELVVIEEGGAMEPLSDAYWSRINTFVSGARTKLDEYAAQPIADRMSQINSMVCDNILDDGFLQLCEDVEDCWRRIGLDFRNNENA